MVAEDELFGGFGRGLKMEIPVAMTPPRKYTWEDFSPAERRAMEAFKAEGSIKKAALKMNRSDKSVKFQFTSIYRKVGVQSNTELMKALFDGTVTL